MRAAVATISAALFLFVPVSALPEISARSAILIDGASGRVLYEKDADRKSLIASTTKIMTATVAIEQCDLDMQVVIPPEATGIEGSSIYLKPGETLCVKELLYGLMLHSGNDAAVALAIAAGGSVEDFVALMNEKARQLGMTQSEFANPNGLDDEHNYSTARDMAKLTQYAMELEAFREIVSTKAITVGNRSLANHNKLLWRYEGAEGVKTGYTKKAGRILVSSAERDGRRLIAVTINAPSDWNDHTQLLDYGFEQFSLQTVLTKGERIGEVPVVSGVQEAAGLVTDGEFSYPLAQDETAEFVVCAPKFCFAPVTRTQPAGWVKILVGGKPVGEVQLVWEDSVLESQQEHIGFLERLFGN